MQALGQSTGQSICLNIPLPGSAWIPIVRIKLGLPCGGRQGPRKGLAAGRATEKPHYTKVASQRDKCAAGVRYRGGAWQFFSAVALAGVVAKSARTQLGARLASHRCSRHSLTCTSSIAPPGRSERVAWQPRRAAHSGDRKLLNEPNFPRQ